VSAQEPNPWLIAFLENEAVEAWEWPEGATVYLSIANAPDFIRSGTAAPPLATAVVCQKWRDNGVSLAGPAASVDTNPRAVTHLPVLQAGSMAASGI